MALHHPVAATAPRSLDTDLHAWAATYDRVHLDLGAGDGAYPLRLARRHPGMAVIGLDTCLDHLRGARRSHPANLRFVAHDALAWPEGALPPASQVTANFPYGSLLRGLAGGDPGLVARLDALVAPGGIVEVRVNASAFIAGGLDPATGAAGIAHTLRRVPGLRVAVQPLAQAELRAFPSTWAKRLGYGRPTGAWLVTATRHEGNRAHAR